ncbi:hypothetical protein CUMW_225170, partial [Citrus unshiu]
DPKLVIFDISFCAKSSCTDEGNENDFKENDNVSQENEILRRNQPFIEYQARSKNIMGTRKKVLFYMDSISFARKFIDKSLSPITTWTNRDVTNLLSFVKKNGGYGSSKVNLREIHPQQNTAHETFDGTSRKNEECIHNCQHQKELSLVRKDIGRMALELDGLKHSMGSWMQQMQQQKENNSAAVGITSPSRKQQKNDESSHEILTFAELMKRANERPDEDDILEKKLLDEENVEEKHDERILTGESDLNEGKRKQIFYNAAIQDNGRNDDCSIEEESSNQLSVFEVKDMRSRKRKPDCFVNYLTNKERAKTSLEMCIWYLPTIFSQKIVANMACKKKPSIEDFVKNHNIRDKYMSELAVCEKIYIPINDGFAHWYLAVLIVKTQTVEIWDSLPSNSSNSHREEIVRAIIMSQYNQMELTAVAHNFLFSNILWEGGSSLLGNNSNDRSAIDYCVNSRCD